MFGFSDPQFWTTGQNCKIMKIQTLICGLYFIKIWHSKQIW